MKNLKVGMKIFVGFAVVICMMLIMGATIIVTTQMSNDSIKSIERSTSMKDAMENTLTALGAARIQANIIYNLYNPEANDAFAVCDAEVKRLAGEALALSTAGGASGQYTKDIQAFIDSYGTWSHNVQSVIQINDELTDLGNQGTAAADSIYATFMAGLRKRIDSQAPASQVTISLTATENMAYVHEGIMHIRDTFDGADAESLKDKISDVVAVLNNSIPAATDSATKESLTKALASCNSLQELIDTFTTKNSSGWDLVDATREMGKANETMIVNLSAAIGLDMESDIAAATQIGEMTMWIVCAVLVFSLAVSILMGIIISRLITIPTQGLSFSLSYLAETGNLQLPDHMMKLAQQVAKRKDELGQTANSYGALMQRLGYIAEELEKVAEGNLSSDIKLASENDVMGLSLRKMNDKLNVMFGQINTSTAQVSVGAKQIAGGAQTLAEGSTEQAASVEELSSSIASVSAQTQENAKRATDAAQLSASIIKDAEMGSQQMRQMMRAVDEINKSSQEISKVIKVIDDIAFQTNILALNAAVEAARAGQHGKSFAVVAEEVRTLAAKSAEAARNTGEMITNSMEKAEFGARIAQETAMSLEGIVNGITQSGQIVNDIADSSMEQSAAINEINIGIEQVTNVVQQNSATAQESAAASQEMSSQADVLEDLVAQFKLRDDNRLSAPKEASYLPAGIAHKW